MKKNILLLAVAMLVACGMLGAQNFVTRWNLGIAGSGATQLSIRTVTNGTVNYSWQQLPSGASGSGSWSGTPLTITGLPAGATIQLQIAPANFQRLFINYDADCHRLSQVEQWGSTAWTSMANAFQGCTNLQITATDVPNLSGVSSLSQMFEGCTNLNSPANINTWNTATVTNMSYMFAITNAFDQNIGTWNTAAVTNMQGMFYRARAFNQPIGIWNTAAVTNMFLMFYQANVFNQNIGSWNTGAVMDMSSMFNGASAFNQNIGAWNTASATNMSFMFFRADVFNQNIGAWNTSSVTNMTQMFYEAMAFNQNIGSWNTAAVTDMSSMFNGASSFNQNMGTWDLNPQVDLTSMLNNSGMNCINYSATLIGWAANAITPDSRTMGAAGLLFGTNAEAARTTLTVAKTWTITDDAASGSSCDIVLPITWLYVNGKFQNGNASIKWSTVSEGNTYKFDVEHSLDGIYFSGVGSVAAAGNSNLTQRYEFLHIAPVVGKNFYRIKQMDFDGKFSYSSIILLKQPDIKTTLIISPNPTQNIVTIYFEDDAAKKIQLFSINGMLLQSEQMKAGSITHKIYLDKYSSGVYLLRLQNNNGYTIHKIIKQ